LKEFEREIWFKCNSCGRESYCEAEFNESQDAEVMCPFCRKLQKLDEVRLSR
jgi:hypothetical protein